MVFNRLNNWLKSSFRLILTTVVCGLLLFSSIVPAAQATPVKGAKGEANLNRIQAKTDEAANPDANPRGIEEITKEAQKGTNAVQGGADAEKMVSPGEAKDATTVEEQAKGFLEKLTN